MNINYRRADLSNQNEIQKIAEIDTTIPALFDGKFKINPTTISESYERLMKFQSDDFFDLAVTDKGRIIGFHAMNKFRSTHGAMAANIHTLWVEPEFRNQGIAKVLKERGELWAKEQDLDHIATFVHGKNSAMNSLNEKMGYELVGYKLRKLLK